MFLNFSGLRALVSYKSVSHKKKCVNTIAVGFLKRTSYILVESH